MNRIKLLSAITAALILISCSKENDKPDMYAAFKADATPRWENGATVEKNHENLSFNYISDMGGSLFSSAKLKIGRMSADGKEYELIEFSGQAVAGKATDPSIRKPSGVVSLYSLDIVKTEGGKLWIVFKETANAVERKIVQ